MEESLKPAGRFLHALTDYLDPPSMYRSAGKHRGFRYANPDARHFCLLKGVRMVSGAYACIQLARGGFNQELFVIIRSIVESGSHIDWVLLVAHSDGSLPPSSQATFVSRYFADFRRGEPSDALKPQVRQEEVHRTVGARLDDHGLQDGSDFDRESAKTLMSNVYLNYSNFVHTRYPEVMDLYGGEPGTFHLRGMCGTPKDAESCAVIATFITTVALTIASVAQHFSPPFIEGDPQFQAWISGL
jgi:hypothetical protein